MDVSVLYNIIYENLTKIEVVVIYGMCTCNHPENIWDFLTVIKWIPYSAIMWRGEILAI